MRWFTSDLHLGHTNIIGFCDRPYYTVDQMNEALVDNWNMHVANDDEVWVLGDMVMGKMTETLPLIGFLNGHKTLVPGNHDRIWAGLKPKRRREDSLYLDAGFDRIEHGDLGVVELTLGEHEVLACHFPYTVGQYDERFSGNHPVDRGKPLLHGHTHSPIRVRDRMIHVGVDAWDYSPVAETQLIDILNNLD